MKVESVTKAVCNLAMQFGEGEDAEEGALVRASIANATCSRPYIDDSHGRLVWRFLLEASIEQAQRQHLTCMITELTAAMTLIPIDSTPIRPVHTFSTTLWPLVRQLT